jgi:predicted MFS family arabinose efflux permease
MTLPASGDGDEGRAFHGWRMVAFAAVALGMTGPGQTVGVSVFIDPMMEALALSRSEISAAYLVGTLGGAFALPRIGRAIDEHGTRVSLGVAGGLLGAMLIAMGGVRGLFTLAVGFVGIRMMGQGALGLVASNAVAPWFDRRRGLAIGIVTAVGSAIIALMPLGSTAVIAAVGWRWTWVVLGLMVWSAVLPIAWSGFVDHPRDRGQLVDGWQPSPGGPAGVPVVPLVRSRLAAALSGGSPGQRPSAPSVDWTRAEALRTPMFWALTCASATTAMLGTALGFHQIDLLGEQGLTVVEAAANFIPQTVATFATVIAVGALSDRIAPRWLITAAMALLAGAMLAVPFVRPDVTAVLYGIAVGASGAIARSLEAASMPRLFGLRHLGAIRGATIGVVVAASALGPLALSLGYDATGSYVEVLRVLVLIPAAIAVLGLLAPMPRRRPR